MRTSSLALSVLISLPSTTFALPLGTSSDVSHQVDSQVQAGPSTFDPSILADFEANTLPPERQMAVENSRYQIEISRGTPATSTGGSVSRSMNDPTAYPNSKEGALHGNLEDPIINPGDESDGKPARMKRRVKNREGLSKSSSGLSSEGVERPAATA
jgi:hypothetical protein